MADTLSNEEKFLKNVSKVKISDRPIFKANMSKLREIGNPFSRLFGANAEKTRENLGQKRTELLSALSEDLKSITLLEDLVWDNLSSRDQKTILNIVKDIQTMSGIDVGIDSIRDNMDAVLSKCIEVIDKVGEQLKALASVGSFTQDNLEGILTQLDKGIIKGSDILIPSKEDLDIVTALKMTGIDLQFNGSIWELKSTPSEPSTVSFVPTKDGRPLQVFGNDNIQFLLNNYLNVPHSQRQSTVVPSKLLQVYISEYERQLSGDGKTGLEKSVIDVEVAKQGKIFSVNSDEFKITKLLDRDTLMRNAQSSAFIAAFEEIVKGAKNTTKVSGEISGIISSLTIDSSYKDVIKNLGKLVPMLDRAGNSFEDATEFEGGQDFVAEYDKQIEYFKRTKASSEHIQALITAKSEFIQAVAIQQAFWQTRLLELAASGNIFGDELAKSINESMGFAVMQKEGEFVMANGQTIQEFLNSKNIPSETYQQIISRLQRQQETAEATNESGENNISKLPDIFGDYCELFGGENIQQVIIDYSNLQFYQFLWQNKFDIEFLNFQRENGESGTLDAFIENLRATNPMFDPDCVEEAYYLLHPEAAKDKAEVIKRAQDKIKSFDKHILLTDLMLKSFTPDELATFESMTDSVKNLFLNSKFKEAEKALETLSENPDKYKESLELAKKRHEPNIVGSTIAHMWQGAPEADAEAGKGPIVTSAVRKFLEDQNAKRNKNNQELAAKGEPILDIPENLESEQEGDNSGNGNKAKKTTFGDMYPSGPNTNKFLKKMKPYHPKEITKFFIDPLLEALDGIEINMDAYYNKINSSSSMQYVTTPPQLTKEQKKALEEQLQQREQQVLAVKQRDFEASAFIPAYMMFERVLGNAIGKPEYQSAGKLMELFKNLATTGDIIGSEKLGVKTPDGKDVRDDLRTLALRICSGEFKGKGAQSVQQELGPILTKYGVDPQVQEDIKEAFQFVTPELLAIALAPVSTVVDNKLVVGSLLPHNLIIAENDKDRWASFAREFKVDNHIDTVEMLAGALGTIYRTQDGSEVDKSSIDYAFDVKLSHENAEFSQVKDTDHMKALLKKMREQAVEYLQQDESSGMDGMGLV